MGVSMGTVLLVSMGTVLSDNPEKRVVTENRPTLDTEPSPMTP